MLHCSLILCCSLYLWSSSFIGEVGTFIHTYAAVLNVLHAWHLFWTRPVGSTCSFNASGPPRPIIAPVAALFFPPFVHTALPNSTAPAVLCSSSVHALKIFSNTNKSTHRHLLLCQPCHNSLSPQHIGKVIACIAAHPLKAHPMFLQTHTHTHTHAHTHIHTHTHTHTHTHARACNRFRLGQEGSAARQSNVKLMFHLHLILAHSCSVSNWRLGRNVKIK